MRDQFHTIEYGKLVAITQGQYYPVDDPLISNRSNIRGNRDLWIQFPDYANCRKYLYLPISGQGFDISHINNTFELVTFINTVMPNDTVSCLDSIEIRFWDEIDPAIPPITKVYGQNGTMARIIQPRYKGNKGSGGTLNTADPNARWNRFDYITYLNSMWAECWGSALEPNPINWTDGHFGCFWINRNWKTRYDLMPPSALRIEVSNTSNRNVQLGADPTQVALAPFDTYVAQNVINAPSIIGIQTPGNTALQLRVAEFNRNTVYGISTSYSFTIGYPMLGGGGDKSVLIKPMGMDQVYLSYFDESRYDLVVLTRNADRDAYPLIHTVAPSEAQRGFSQEMDVCGPWTSSVWTKKMRSLARPLRNDKEGATVRFMLRDKITNKVSVASEGEMRLEPSTRPMPPIFRVRTNRNY